MITKQKIFEIIAEDVCGMCNGQGDTIKCNLHHDRCHMAYNRQAEKIMELIEKEESE